MPSPCLVERLPRKLQDEDAANSEIPSDHRFRSPQSFGVGTVTRTPFAGSGAARPAAVTGRHAMTTFGFDRIGDEVILAARILLVVLFLIFGWSKLVDFSGTVAYMAQTGVPAPAISALVAIAVEAVVSIAVVLGIWALPVAIVLALYALATAFLGDHYWAMTGAARFENETNFYKNLSIMGGFLLLYVTGAGKYSLDARRGASLPDAKLRSV